MVLDDSEAKVTDDADVDADTEKDAEDENEDDAVAEADELADELGRIAVAVRISESSGTEDMLGRDGTGGRELDCDAVAELLALLDVDGLSDWLPLWDAA